ncbi:DUF3841 domain-containing protein [Streptomyces sp. NPDC047108]|uniref:DUF3841 domain-containing protein n=1 Tax=Streptomyces sp. NPDC047108 TaxID=3155025 RepID=UPI00340EC9BB
MRLWTVQHHGAVPVLHESGLLTGDWSRVAPSLRPGYDLMVAEMRRRGIDDGGCPPVWAWAGPDSRDGRVLQTARSLLSQVEWERGVVVLDLEVPDALVVTSSYGWWNDVLAAVLSGEPLPPTDFSTGPDDEREEEFRIQAVLPLVRRAWVRDVRPLAPPADLVEDWPDLRTEPPGPSAAVNGAADEAR